MAFMTDNYDGQKDGHDSYYLALAEIRRRKLLAGEVDPVNDEEREMVK